MLASFGTVSPAKIQNFKMSNLLSPLIFGRIEFQRGDLNDGHPDLDGEWELLGLRDDDEVVLRTSTSLKYLFVYWFWLENDFYEFADTFDSFCLRRKDRKAELNHYYFTPCGVCHDTVVEHGAARCSDDWNLTTWYVDAQLDPIFED